MSAAAALAESREWPVVLVPTDRPRSAGRIARCTASAALPRDCFPVCPDRFLLACFAALLFRHTGQPRISVDHGDGSTRYLVTGDVTVTELPQLPGPTAAGEGCELRLVTGPWTVELHYDPALFDAATAGRLLARLRTLATDAAAAPRRPVKLLRLMPAAELRNVLVDWNDTSRLRDDQACLHTGFEASAVLDPAATAVVYRGQRWSYAQIDGDANRLAHLLRTRGVGPDVRVGICLPRSPNLLISMLAVLKAGGAFVPIDPQLPRARIATMISGSRCALMITVTALAGQFNEGATPQLLLDRDTALLAGQPATALLPLAMSDNLCYIIHTSGSTGTPKPIALRHEGVTNNIDDLVTRFGIGPADSVLALSSPSFDMSIFEFLGLTAVGGTVVIPDPAQDRDPAHWARLIAEEGVTLWNSAPAMLGLLTDQLQQAAVPAALPSLRLALLGGDWVPLTLPGQARYASPDLRVIVLGGATEASIHSTIFEVEDVDPAWTSIPYGRPMSNQRTYILDENGQAVPPGVAGELCLAGTGLARGYLDRPELTVQRFFEWSFGEVRDERLYRTGDLARYGPDGLIELLGRIDLQVKINGQRIELGEIESVLAGHPGVRQVALVARKNQLVGYVVLSRADVTAAQLIRLAAERLPHYMVPAHIVVLDGLPLSPNGKVDRAALPDPASDRSDYRAASTPTERVLAQLVGELLDVDRVGLDDDFLSLGGDSVRAIQLVSRAAACGIAITANDVLGLRTVAGIAAAEGTPTQRAATSFEVVDLAGRDELRRRYPGLADVVPLTPMQAGMLFEVMLDDRSDGVYQLQTIIELTGPPDADRLHQACVQLVARHASLRTAFVYDVADNPVQVVLDTLEPPWREVDLTQLGSTELDPALDRLLAAERELLAGPASPPLLRFMLLSLPADRAVLVLTAHHLLYDGWSEQLLAGELAQLYAGTELPPAGDFRDHLRWLAMQDRAMSISAWQARLAGLDGPTLLSPRTAGTQPIAMRQQLIPLGRHELVPDRRLQITRATIAQAAWAIVLAELTGRAEVTFGVTVSGRSGQLPAVESMVGLFINTIPLRVHLEPEQQVAELFAQLTRSQLGMLAHEYLGLSDIHQAAGVSHLFDTLLVCQSFPAAGTGNELLGLARIESVGMGSYPLALLVETDRLVIQYDEGRHTQDGIAAIGDRFRQLATELVAAEVADRRVGSLLRAGQPGRTGDEPAAAPSARDDAGPIAAADRSDLEATLCLLLAEVLGVERVEADDDIFSLGCNSLKATRIIGRLRRSVGVDTSIRTLFENPTVAQLAPKLSAGGPVRPALGRRAGS